MNDTALDAPGHQKNRDNENDDDQPGTDAASASISCTYGGSIRAQRASPAPAKPLPTATVKRRRSESPADPEYINSYACRLRKRLSPVLTDIGNIRQVALTVDRQQQPDPAQAYEQLQRQVSEVFRKLRRNGTITESRYVWFLEFHADGFPHLHVLYSSKRSLSEKIQQQYTLGRVIEKRFRTLYDHLGYVTKQLNRSAIENLPSWFAELSTTTARRYRTSRGFFPNKSQPKRSEPTAPRTSRPVKTVSERQAELAADPRGDVYAVIPRRDGKRIKLNCAAIADRSELQRLFGTSSITIDRLADTKATSPIDFQIVDAVLAAFREAYRRNSRKNLSVVARATADHLRLSSVYGWPIVRHRADSVEIIDAAA